MQFSTFPLLLLLLGLFVPLIAAGGIRIAHALPGSNDIVVSFNGSGSIQSIEAENEGFWPDSGYQLFNFTNAVSPNVIVESDSKSILINTSFSLDSNTFYTLLIGAKDGENASATLLTDDLLDTTTLLQGTQMAGIRLIVAIPVNDSVSFNANTTSTSTSLGNVNPFSDSAYVPVSESAGFTFYVTISGSSVSLTPNLHREAIYSILAYPGKNSDIKLALATDAQPPNVAFIRAVYAITDLDAALDFTLQYPSQNVTIASGLNYFTVSAYTNSTPGSALLNVTKSSNGESVFQTVVSFDDLKNYTIGVVGNNNTDNYKLIFLDDDFFTTSDTSAWVRVANLVPDSDNLTVNITTGNSDNQLLITSIYPASEGQFLALVGTGDSSTMAVAGASLKESLSSSFTFNNGTAYTIWLRGDIGSVSVTVTQDFPTPSESTGLTNLELGLIIGGAITFVILLLAIIIFALRTRPSDGYEKIDN